MKRVALVAILLAVLAPCSAFAQGSYQPYPLGLRTAGMGGAAAAFGQDSAMPLINPAGVARGTAHSVALSANALLFDAFSVGDFYSITDDNRGLFDEGELPATDLDGTSFAIFPSSFAYVLPLDDDGDHFLALGLFVPFNSDSKRLFELVFEPNPAISLSYLGEQSRTLTVYNAGPTYAVRVSEQLTLGVSAFVRYTDIVQIAKSEIRGFDLLAADVQFSPNNIRDEATSFDLELALGAQVGPYFGFSAGAAVHTPTIHLGGGFRRDARILSGDSAAGLISVTDLRITADDFDLKAPPWFTLGLGYEQAGRFAVAIDVSFHLPLGAYDAFTGVLERSQITNGFPALLTTSESRLEEERVGVFNVNVGGEVTVTPRILARAGFFTDFSSAVDLPPLAERDLASPGGQRTDRIGATLGLAFAGERTQFQAGFVYRHTFGTIIGLELPSGRALDRDYVGHAFMFAFSGEIDAGTILGAAQAAAMEELQAAPEGSSGGRTGADW